MKKYAWLLGSLLALALLFSGTGPTWASHSGTTILVDGNDSTSDGSPLNCGDSGNPCNTVQNGVDHASPGDTVQVEPGTYVEQVFINKDLILEGINNPTIKAPGAPEIFTIPESGSSWEPVIFAYGGSDDGNGNISGSATINVSITGVTIDGDDRVPTDRSAGILLRNVKSTGISNNTVQKMNVNGHETFGIIVYGDSDVTISDNSIHSYSRGGIAVNGDLGSLPDPHGDIIGNTITGPGKDAPVTWAPNGIQIGVGATGSIVGNTVSQNGWPGDDWSGTAILVFASESIVVEDNEVITNETGIGTIGDVFFGTNQRAKNLTIRHNTLDANTWGIAIQDHSDNLLIEQNSVSNSEENAVSVFHFGRGDAPVGTTVIFNNITGSGTYGLEVSSNVAAPIDAQCNWWGDASGPSSAGPGTGDAVTGPANFDPWLEEPAPSACDVGFVTGGGWFESPPDAYKSPSPPEGWHFVEEIPVGSGEIVVGPDTPPLGVGSAEFAVDDTGREILILPEYHGLRLDSITKLEYSTYRQSGASSLGISLQLNFDDDVTDDDQSWKGRIVFEPSNTGQTVLDNTWQTWDTLQGQWWGSADPLQSVCPIGDPCTWQEVLSNFPNAGVNEEHGGVLLKAGGPWAGGFVGNADALVLGIDGQDTIYDFDPPTGEATFGFVSKYKKGADVPVGNTQFVFKAADLNFHSSEYEWLVVAGDQAKFKGSGTINGEGDFGFQVTARDGDLNGGVDQDKFRIKIWDKATDTVVYDNGVTTPLGGGNIVIHEPKK